MLRHPSIRIWLLAMLAVGGCSSDPTDDTPTPSQGTPTPGQGTPTGTPGTPTPTSGTLTPATETPATPGSPTPGEGTPTGTPDSPTPDQGTPTPGTPTERPATPTAGGETPGATPTSTPLPATLTPVDRPYGLTERLPNATCRIEGAPGTPSGLTLEPAFPRLTFTVPIYLTHAGDGSNLVFVVEQYGIIRVFDNDPNVASADEFLNLTDRVTYGGELGLLGLAFHPDYEANGYFYVYYTAPSPLRSVVSRFQVDPANPRRALKESEYILLEFSQPYSNHNGGMIEFGPDGHLYIASGDGGSGGDPHGNGQNTSTLLGKILRIDVDHPSGDRRYGIPADNPFAAATDGRRPEIYAWGLRNPWRFSFDRLTGRLWAGDVGQGTWEEVDVIVRGGNYGWNLMEGTTDTGIPGDRTDLILPVAQYSHNVGLSITGGYVYRGSRMPELYGLYLYADFSLGRFWALEYDGQKAARVIDLMDTDYAISSFGEDEAGEVYVVKYYGGYIYRFARSTTAPAVAPFPTKLSETGCFADVAAREPAPGVIGYSVNSPLWADYARKDRFVAIPDDTRIGFNTAGAWDLPPGSVTFKDFYLEEEVGNPFARRLLETRMYVHYPEGWRGYTYKWDEAQRDAYLLDGSLTETYEVRLEDGTTADYRHYYPSRSDCQACHTAAAGVVLGLQTGQMNRDHDYDGVIDNQLRALDHIGLFTSDLPGPYDAYARYPDPADESLPLEWRARSYLQANCAHCHQPGGTAISTLDLRYETPLEAMNACGEEPLQGDLGMAGALLIDPGVPEASILILRMERSDDQRMPPLASSILDDLGIEVVSQWIAELEDCP